MSRRDFHNPDSLYTRDPSLRFHMSGRIEPLDNERFHWEHGVITAIVMLAIAGGIWGII